MTTAQQQDALTQTAKQLFADTFTAKGEELSTRDGMTLEASVKEAMITAIFKTQAKYGVAIAFYLAHDFANYFNHMPGNIVQIDLMTFKFDDAYGSHLN